MKGTVGSGKCFALCVYITHMYYPLNKKFIETEGRTEVTRGLGMESGGLLFNKYSFSVG